MEDGLRHKRLSTGSLRTKKLQECAVDCLGLRIRIRMVAVGPTVNKQLFCVRQTDLAYNDVTARRRDRCRIGMTAVRTLPARSRAGSMSASHAVDVAVTAALRPVATGQG